VESARRALLGLGPFGSVRVEPGTSFDANGDFPIAFVVRERAARAVGVNLSWETNYGFTGRVFWEHRNLFGGAERLRLEGEVSRFAEGVDLQHINYRAFITYRTPEVFRRDVQMTASLGAVRERLDAYDRDVALASLLFEHSLTDRLVLQAGPGYEVGRVGRDDVWTNVNLVSFVGGLRYDSTDNLLNPTRGWRLSGTATPYVSLNGGADFARLVGTASTYWNVFGDGRSVLALRGLVGSAVGASRDELPLDKRFYAGGGGSVRGFPYLSIGPLNAANQPMGGASVVEGSVEWRQRITGPWGVVGFVDAGSVGNTASPTVSDLRIGVGAGVRYLTAIGPIRLDVAVPVNPEPGGPGYGVYVGIGQAF
jgi:translocation and assembly module TamA